MQQELRSGRGSGCSHLEQGDSQGHEEDNRASKAVELATHNEIYGKGMCAVLLFVTHQQTPPNQLAGNRYNFVASYVSVLLPLHGLALGVVKII